MNTRNAVSIAALLALLAFSVVAIGRQGVHWLPPADQHHAVLAVADANGIVAGSKLLLRGVPIGRVIAVHAAADGVEIEFGYHDSYRIPVDSDFRIESLSSLGESYVAILPKSTAGPYFADDQHIQAQVSIVPRTFGDLSAALTRMLDGIPPDTANSLVDELESALPADIMVVHNLSRASALLASTLLMSTGSIRDLLTDGQDVLARSGAVGPTLAETSDPARLLGVNFAALAQTAIDMMQTNDYPRVVQIGPLTLFGKLQRFEDQVGPDIRKLAGTALPGIRAAADSAGMIDISRLLDTALSAVAVPGAVTLHVTTPR
ncbi:MlaD family protein [Nocardia sp. NBC_01503]|uniref:MlaD family protein n=1 Tax=Nocardia sp. NBC_01503 TaxID=2975997 RepID=UPI002E7B8498|nr:MlaD family protein [Nocardia sp. NBC_01503]WTL32141.1 MlaD family protein [Nocardia sp. NBC_01503]